MYANSSIVYLSIGMIHYGIAVKIDILNVLDLIVRRMPFMIVILYYDYLLFRKYLWIPNVIIIIIIM